jgi:hypothetical protein
LTSSTKFKTWGRSDPEVYQIRKRRWVAHCRTFPIIIYALGGRNNPPQPLCLSHLSYTDPGKYERGCRVFSLYIKAISRRQARRRKCGEAKPEDRESLKEETLSRLNYTLEVEHNLLLPPTASNRASYTVELALDTGSDDSRVYSVVT